MLGRQVQPSCQKTCLETLRILSRDKRVLAPVATREGMLILGEMARLNAGEEAGDNQDSSQEHTQSEEEERVVVEALKCLCNVVYNSPAAQQASVDVQLIHGLCANLRTARTWHHDVGLFTLRLLFLLSALRPDVRGVLRREKNAVKLLTEVLEHTLDVSWVGPYETARPDPQGVPLPAEENERAMEALKALFNLTLSPAGGEVSTLWLCDVAHCYEEIWRVKSRSAGLHHTTCGLGKSCINHTSDYKPVNYITRSDTRLKTDYTL